MNGKREGLIPTVLGTAVATTGALMSRNSRGKKDKVAWGIMGFGLAHVVLGAIDIVQHRNE
ncbi:asparagine synthase [Wukongibacter sp. M2B1]|uniref:asparagine synthase n=1 Tax=Wukongibacter sp. M2B1 TaxID=3088895 RepID=UPI003D7A8873